MRFNLLNDDKRLELVPQEQENHQAMKASALGTDFDPPGRSAPPSVAANEKVSNTDFECIFILLWVLDEGNKWLTVQNVWN